jgi:CP family cyanate transporter-like MFS transporter
VAVLVAAGRVDFIEDGHDGREKPDIAQASGQLTIVEIRAGKGRPYVRVRSAVVLREGGLGKRTSSADYRMRPTAHAHRVREHNPSVTSPPHPRPRWLIILAIAMVAINLRIALSSVSALVSYISDATGWSDAVIGMLTTIPVLCMGTFALLVPRIARKIGRRHTVALALGLLIVALSARLFAEVPGVLHSSALVAGVGIALAGGLVPSVVREDLPESVGRATGTWTAAMMTGAALGGALTVPLAIWLDSWPKALAIWAIPAVAGLIAWTLAEARRPDEPDNSSPSGGVRISQLPWRNRTAWSLTAYLALNSIVFYTSLAWLASSYVERGWSRADAGLLLGLFTASQVIGALVMPAVAERSAARRLVYAAFLSGVTVCVLAIGWAPDSLTLVVVAVLGLCLGAGFAMVLALLSEYALDGAGSARLTAMAFSVTYLVAATGPVVAGLLLDRFQSWPLVFSLLAGACFAQFATIPALRRGVHIT